MLRSLITAFRTLTILPIPGKDTDKLASAFFWFPLAGFLLGLIMYGMAVMFGYDAAGRWPEGTAVLLVVLSVILTRGLHLDGITDWADGFWGGRSKEAVLRIMKDSRTGTFGAAALVCILLAKWVCFVQLIELEQQKWIVAAYVISRTMQVAMAATHSYAREDGTGASFIRDANAVHFIVAVVLAAGLLFAWHGFYILWLPGLVLGWIITRLFGTWARLRIGGVTGDLLGANSEIVEVAVLAVGVIPCLPAA